MSHHPISRSPSAHPHSPPTLLNWHLSPSEAAEMFSALVDDEPTTQQLVTSEEVPLDSDDETSPGPRQGTGTSRGMINSGALLFEHLLELERAVAFRILQEDRWDGSFQTEISSLCWTALRLNGKKQLDFERYSAALAELRTGFEGRRQRTVKPLWCRDSQAATKMVNLFCGAADGHRPLMRLLDKRTPLLGYHLAHTIVQSASESLPLAPDDFPNSLPRVLALARIGWSHLTNWEMLQALAFAYKHELDAPSTEPAARTSAAAVQRSYSSLMDSLRTEYQHDEETREAARLIGSLRFNHRMLLRALRLPTTTRYFSTTPNIMKRVEISLSEHKLEDGKMKEVPFPTEKDAESKILLSKVKGKYYATSAKCTHYGAPLVKGVLTESGRVVCPWHGACFDVCSGDIEDAPGLDNLSSFKVEEKDGSLVIEAPEDVAATRQPRACASDKNGKGVVIIGGGAGAAHAVEELREQGFDGRIRVISAENYLPIDRTKLSKALIADPKKVALRSADFYEKLGVEFLLGQEASKIDFEADVVSLKNGDKIEYETLIVATGSTPNRLPVDGAKLDNIFVMRNIDDAAAIDKALGSDQNVKKNVVVVGSSFIGMEVALAASARANVTVVGMEDVPFQAILGKEIGAGVKKFHESKGTKFYLPASLSHFEASKESSSAVGAVVLKDGTSIPADLVVLGVGVKPATSVLKESGVKLEKDGSVKTDEFLRIGGEGMVKGNVFAIGDIATYRDFKTNKDVRVEHWNVASNHARNVAQTLTRQGSPYEKVAVFWSAQGQQLRYAGTSRSKEWKDVIVQGQPDDLKFVAYYTIDDDVVAIASMQNDPIAAHVSELFRLDKMLSVSDINAGKSPLDVKLGEA